MRHGILTIVTPIVEGREQGLRDRLRALDQQPSLFAVLNGLHFASFSIIDDRADEPDAPSFRPHLVFEASFDGTREDFIDDLVALRGDTVDQVYGNCQEYPSVGRGLPELVKNYLFEHDYGADTLYIGYPGRTVGQIRQEEALHRVVATAFDEIDRTKLRQGAFPPPMQRSLLVELRLLVSTWPELSGALTLPERPFVVTYGRRFAEAALRTFAALAFLGFVVFLYEYLGGTPGEVVLPSVLLGMAAIARLIGVWREPWKRTARFLLVAALAVPLFRYPTLGLVAAIDWATQGLIVMGVAAVGFAWLLFVVVVGWSGLVQLLEWSGPAPTPPHWDKEHEDDLRRRENALARGPQNHMVGLNRIKPGWIRWVTLRLVLWTIHVSKHLEKSGMLSGISSIHFARWVIIDRGRQLLFLSHYDGDWDAYLGDFVAQASAGLTAIWSNCVGFPRAYFLFGGGARDERGFKAYARNHQHETLCLYSAYRELTVADIEKHTAIREALGRSLDAAGLDALVRSI